MGHRLSMIAEWATTCQKELWRGDVARRAGLITQDRIVRLISTWGTAARAFKTLVRTTRLTTTFTRFTLFAERPVAVLRIALDPLSAVVSQEAAYCM